MIDNAALHSEEGNSSIAGPEQVTREESNVDNKQHPVQNQDENRYIFNSTTIIILLSFSLVCLPAVFHVYGLNEGIKDAQREKYKSLHLEFMKDNVAFLCMRSRYKETSYYLDHITSQEENRVLSVSLELRIAECYTQQGRKKRAEEVLNATKLVPMPSLSQSDEVSLSAQYFIENESYIRAVFLLRIASDMYRSNMSSPNISVDGIAKCIGKTFNATITMLELGPKFEAFAISYGLQYMLEMLDDLRSVENADPARKARQIAWCMRYIGRVYNWTEEYQKSNVFYKNGIKILEQEFGPKNSSKYKIYGLLLNNIGESYNQLAEIDRENSISQELGKIATYNKAENYFEKATNALKYAIDCKNKTMKKKLIKKAKSNLSYTNTLVKNEILKVMDLYTYENYMTRST